MANPKIAGTSPIPVEFEEGKTYAWCTCGESKNQPFCDGAHKGSDFAPLKVTATESKKVFLCTCKHSKNSCYCDGTHKSL